MILEFLKGFAAVIVYFVICASVALLLRRFVNVPAELFRKILHMILLCSLFVWVYGFGTWWMAVVALLVFVAVVYPVLKIAERIDGYSQLLVERKNGEIKNSLIVVFVMFAAIIALCWGLLDDKLLVFACIFAWGFGDGAAALVGKGFGKHTLQGRMIEGSKSVEGSAAMFVVSFLSVIVVLLLRGGLHWYAYAPVSLLAAFVCTVVELYTRNGMDTITCPLAAAAVIVPLVNVWGTV